jgi:minor extracellular serine protease Vpr
MKKCLLFTFVILCTLCISQARPNVVSDKLSAGLKLFLLDKHNNRNMLLRKNNIDFIPVFIRVTDKKAFSLLRQSGAYMHSITGNIITADIPVDSIERMAGFAFVSRIELPLLLRKTDEKLNDIIHATGIHNGISPLTRAYKGKDVVIGVIDDGIDFTHPDFYTIDGKCRIKYLWNMDHPGNPPAGFNYGYEYSGEDLQKFASQIKNHEINKWEIEPRFGYAFHGTSVTGLAAGNNGIAPEADIISVALTAYGDTVLRSDRLVNGIAYIAAKASAENKKAIVNISLGISDGAPHDGTSMVEEAIDYLCAENPDLLVCVSAGNNGNNWKHWGGFPIDKDSSYSFFYNSYTGSLYFSIPRKYRDSITISIAESPMGNLNAPNISRDSIFYQSPFFSIRSLQDSARPLSFFSVNKHGQQRSQITFASSPFNAEYDELIIKVNSDLTGSSTVFDPHLYRFILKGSGTVHAWFPFVNLHPMFLFDQNPLPNDPAFHLSDNDFTTTIPSNGFTVLSVGAFNIRTCFVNIQKHIVAQYPACRLAYFTSHGPTLDGRIKPDLVAPGDNVMSPRSRFDDYYGHYFIVDTNTLSFSGTSASSPIVAGAAALLWQKFPLFRRDSIMALIKNNTQKDFYTEQYSPTPNNLSGWGKLDVFKAITGIELPPFDCSKTDTCAGEVVPPPGMPDTPSLEYFVIYPNPTYQSAMLKYRTSRDFLLELLDINGRKLVPVIPVRSGESRLSLPIQLLPAGLYFTRITFNDKTTIKPLKLVLLH